MHVLDQTCRTAEVQKITSFFFRTKQKPRPAAIESNDSDELASEEDIFEEPMQSKLAQAKPVQSEKSLSKVKGQKARDKVNVD